MPLLVKEIGIVTAYSADGEEESTGLEDNIDLPAAEWRKIAHENTIANSIHPFNCTTFKLSSITLIKGSAIATLTTPLQTLSTPSIAPPSSFQVLPSPGGEVRSDAENEGGPGSIPSIFTYSQ